jgi:hypothetical protein
MKIIMLGSINFTVSYSYLIALNYVFLYNCTTLRFPIFYTLFHVSQLNVYPLL